MMSGSDNFCSFVGVQYFICECGEAFQSEDTLRVHLEQKHPRQLKTSVRRLKKVPPPITEYKCGECGNIYPTEEACVTHQEIDHIPYMKEELVYQEEDVEEAITPDIIVPSTSHSSSHPLRVQSLPVKQERTPDDFSIEGQKKPKKKKTYKYKGVQCETCGKSYGSAAAMRYHQRVHTGVKPYKCQYCPKAFTMALFLQVHVRTHTGERPYQCPLCPKAFSNKAALLRHDRVHTGIKPYQCPKCLKSFTQSNSLKLHFHTVHLRMPTPYKSRRKNPEGGIKQEGGIDEVALVKAVREAPKQYYEINTPAGRKIMLTPIVPRRVQEQLPPVPTITEDDPDRLYYVDDIKTEQGDDAEEEDEEVTYEVVYDMTDELTI